MFLFQSEYTSVASGNIKKIIMLTRAARNEPEIQGAGSRSHVYEALLVDIPIAMRVPEQ